MNQYLSVVWSQARKLPPNHLYYIVHKHITTKHIYGLNKYLSYSLKWVNGSLLKGLCHVMICEISVDICILLLRWKCGVVNCISSNLSDSCSFIDKFTMLMLFYKCLIHTLKCNCLLDITMFLSQVWTLNSSKSLVTKAAANYWRK